MFCMFFILLFFKNGSTRYVLYLLIFLIVDDIIGALIIGKQMSVLYYFSNHSEMKLYQWIDIISTVVASVIIYFKGVTTRR